MKPLHKKVAVLSALACLLVVLAAQAAIVFDNGMSAEEGGYVSDVAIPFQIADDFQGVAVIQDVHWLGLYGGAFTLIEGSDDFTVRVFENTTDGSGNDIPGQAPIAERAVVVDRVATGLYSGTGREVFEYWACLNPPITLNSNSAYWLSIVNDTTAYTDFVWAWGISLMGGNCRWRIDDGEPWRPADSPENDGYIHTTGAEMAFQLMDSITLAITTDAPNWMRPQDVPATWTVDVRTSYPNPESVEITAWRCYALNAKGREVDKSKKADIEVNGDTITVWSTAGEWTKIEFTAVATDLVTAAETVKTFTVHVRDAS